MRVARWPGGNCSWRDGQRVGGYSVCNESIPAADSTGAATGRDRRLALWGGKDTSYVKRNFLKEDLNKVIRKHVLCYGDSMSWGIVPGTRQRHSYEKRWPGIFQQLVGPDVRVIEECLNGRTTAWDDPFRPNRNGKDLLLPLLQSHSPVDFVILFLGTNDLQNMYGVNAYASALGVGALVDIIQACRSEPMTVPPKVLLVSPPRIVQPCGTMEEKFRNAEEKSNEFAHWYKRIADERGCFFFDAASVIQPSLVDGVHLDEPQHQQFASSIYRCVAELLDV